MNMNCRCISYNCESFSKNTDFIGILLSQCDILMLQETLLTEHSMNNYSIFDQTWNYVAVPAERNITNFYGKSSGGLVIYYRKSLARYVKPFYCSNRLMGIHLCFNMSNTLLLNVYCPCDYRNAESLSLYQSTMAELVSVRESEQFDNIVIAGDFNCDPNKGRFYPIFCETLEYLSLFAADIIKLPMNTYSYMSRNEACSTSWLDHVISSNLQMVSDIDVMYGLTFEDHLPLKFSLFLQCELVPKIEQNDSIFCNDERFILWSKARNEHIEVYNSRLEEMLGNYINHSVVCNEKFCENRVHIESLNRSYEFLVGCFLLASDAFPCTDREKKQKSKAGWDYYCRNAYGTAREKFFSWKSGGCLRSGDAFEEMKVARKNFRNALNFCKKNELKIRRANITNSFHYYSES